jgi:hypothetical protein
MFGAVEPAIAEKKPKRVIVEFNRLPQHGTVRATDGSEPPLSLAEREKRGRAAEMRTDATPQAAPRTTVKKQQGQDTYIGYETSTRTDRKNVVRKICRAKHRNQPTLTSNKKRDQPCRKTRHWRCLGQSASNPSVAPVTELQVQSQHSSAMLKTKHEKATEQASRKHIRKMPNVRDREPNHQKIVTAAHAHMHRLIMHMQVRNGGLRARK